MNPLPLPLFSAVFKKEISVFMAIATSKSLSAAGPGLNLNQPAISKSLTRLEIELKTKLFSRNRDGIKLTQSGQTLYHTLLKLSEVWQTEQKNDAVKHLTIGCHPSIAIEFFPQFVPAIRKLFPATEFAFQLQTSLQVSEKVSLLEIDLGIVVNPVKRRQVIARPFRQDYVSYWGKSELDSKSLPILVHPDMLYASRIKANASEVLQIPDYEVISTLVKTGNFIGILPAAVAHRYQLQQIERKLFTVDISLIFHEDRFDRETAKKILRLFEE